MTRFCTVAVLLVLGPDAWGYHPPARFDQSANEGGGAGNFFTGSPRFKRWDCTICHVEPEGRIAAVLRTEPDDLGRGSYEPERAYVLTVELYGEHRGLGSRANINTFIANVEDDSGAPRGRFAFDPDVFVGFFERSLVASRGLEARTSWTLEWIAPPAGTGTVTLHLAMLDGDGAGDASAARTDPFGDDVTVATLRLCESGAACEDPPIPKEPLSPASCSVGSIGAPAASLPMFALGMGLALLARRRLRFCAIALLVAACNDPVVPAECPARICGAIGGDGDSDADSDADADADRDAGVEPGQDASVPACNEDWFCGPWEAPPGSDEATRSCVDRNEAGTTECKPTMGPVTLPALDMAYFQCEVEPIFDRGCGMMGCHGTERPLRVFSRGRLRNSEVVQRVDTCLKRGEVDLAEAGSATVMCEGWLPHTQAEWKKNFDSARAFRMGVDDPEDSELLRQAVVGGMPHEGVHLFERGAPDYETIRAWLAGATLEDCDPWPN